ncbi:FBP domain-containing protein [Sediminivirga luteola]|uniref:Elongation factor G-binding protein C-terminal treble-clef zinc-finger domain-containing protein n=1 Tax=Sediminivirga luteola TaxID=1774748 RepID=A0A8J2TV08_9MICO|nr:FBP domain-containing protein [Sediminivirga luteola]GGA02477.1 hypothetical protein GCM10011333_01260 [Sediminivirga luteola]
MDALTNATLAKSFVNASRRDVTRMTLPFDLDTLDWDRLEYLGWTDPKTPQRAYAVVPVDGTPGGILLRAVPSTRNQAMCNWCEDITDVADVRMFSARRAGASGRQGNSVATLLHADFRCPALVRRLPTAVEGGDPEAFIGRRVENLRARAEAFARKVMA